MTYVRALALVYSSLFHAFQGGESIIVPNVLRLQIHPKLLKEAIATTQASHIDQWNKDKVRQILQAYFNNNSGAELNTRNLSDGLSISRL